MALSEGVTEVRPAAFTSASVGSLRPASSIRYWARVAADSIDTIRFWDSAASDAKAAIHCALADGSRARATVSRSAMGSSSGSRSV